jgi:hypothetical protein
MIGREHGDVRLFACPWPECEWVLLKERLVSRASVPMSPVNAGKSFSQVVGEMVASMMHEDVKETDRLIEEHLDGSHPGWTVEEARAHLAAEGLRLRIHGAARQDARVISNDGRILEGEIVE